MGVVFGNSHKMSEFSLHAQGWPEFPITNELTTSVLPARAGMARLGHFSCRRTGGSPCTRRDGPPCTIPEWTLDGFSLHAQGWPGFAIVPESYFRVLPARAGMALRHSPIEIYELSSPCTRRDGPASVITL